MNLEEIFYKGVLSKMNVIVIMGRLTKDPELRTTQSGISVTSFSVAVNRNYSKENQTDFINCVAWRNNAEFITKYFGKGQMIAIKGSLQQRTFTDKDGNKRTTYDVVVDSADFCGNREESKEPDIDYHNADTSEFEDISIDDRDLPF